MVHVYTYNYVLILVAHLDNFLGLYICTGIVHEELTKTFEKTKRALKAALKSKDMQRNGTLSSLNHHHGQQRCDLIGAFASSISTEAAQSTQVDLDSSMEQFRVRVCKYMYMQTIVRCTVLAAMSVLIIS